MTLEVVGATKDVHEGQMTSLVRTTEIVFDLVVSPELSFVKLSVTLSTQDLTVHRLRLLDTGMEGLKAGAGAVEVAGAA